MLEGGPGFFQADHPWRELHLCLLYAPFRRARCVRFPPTWINSSRKGPRACWFPRKYGIHKFVQHSVATKRNRETTYWRRLLERMGCAGLHQVLTTLFDLFALALAKRQCSMGTPVASRNSPFPPISIFYLVVQQQLLASTTNSTAAGLSLQALGCWPPFFSPPPPWRGEKGGRPSPPTTLTKTSPKDPTGHVTSSQTGSLYSRT